MSNLSNLTNWTNETNWSNWANLIMVEPEQFKKSDGTIDWGRYATARLAAIKEKEKAKKIKKTKRAWRLPKPHCLSAGGNDF